MNERLGKVINETLQQLMPDTRYETITHTTMRGVLREAINLYTKKLIEQNLIAEGGNTNELG
jgi:hypothetical protein